MAIELAIETEDGVEHPGAYWRVTEIDIDLRGDQVRVRVEAFHDEAAARAGKRPIAQRWYSAPAGAWAARGALLEAAYGTVKAAKDIAVPAKRDNQYEPGEARLPDTMVGFFEAALDV